MLYRIYGFYELGVGERKLSYVYSPDQIWFPIESSERWSDEVNSYQILSQGNQFCGRESYAL